ncbi:9593_t:CDS:10, partial [Acaulospora morrowiae]
LVKDVHEKLNKEVLDSKSIRESLKEIQCDVEKFLNLQQTARYYELADEIDELGVGIWNSSITLKASRSSNGTVTDDELVALFRQVGFFMVKAGVETSADIDAKNAAKLLTLANKVGKAWLDCGRSDKADELLRSVSLFEDAVLSWENSAKAKNPKSTALVVYYAYRAEAAWKMENSHVANLMIQHATEKKYLDNVTTKEVDILCRVCFTIGSQASREGKASEAIKWLKKCHELISDYVPQTNSERTKLLTNTLNALATCYLKNSVHDESNMDLAENAVNLCLEENPNDVLASSLKLKIMKKRNNNPIPLEEVYIKLMRTTQVTKENLKILLNAAHVVSEVNVMMALRGMDIFIEEKLSETRNINYIERTIVTKFHILGGIDLGDFELNDAIKSIEVTLGFEQRHGIVIGHKTKLACQTILWQNGDKNYSNQKYDLARKWYLAAYKWMTAGQVDDRNAAILQRKIALCYLEAHLLADAIEAVQHAKKHERNSAANFYILYHIEIERRQIEEAIRYLHDMCKGDGFHGNMLAMAANEAYQKGHKTILVEALKEILSKHRSGEDVAHIDVFVLLRCLIRMTHGSLFGSEPEKTSLKDCICSYFEIAFDLLESNYGDKIAQHGEEDENLSRKSKVPLKELEWFFKTAWNMGLEFCQQAEGGSDLFSIRLFDVVYKFLCEYPEETIEYTNQKKICVFASLCGKLFLARRQKSISRKANLLQAALTSIDQYKKLKKVLGKRKRDDAEENNSSTQNDAILVILFEFEAKVRLGLWDELLKVLDAAEAHDFEIPSKIYERMTELLINEEGCPSTVVFSTLQVLLNSIMKQKYVDIEQFSRWFRMLIITAMVKDKSAAMQYFDQALDILSQGCSKGKYPEEEIQWLMVNAWNCGIDYYSSSDYTKAKKWCECAISFCKFLNNGLLYEEEMRKSYDEIIKNCDIDLIDEA